jgi:pimeloyl-ACP methyl ester carboxylesterase
VRPLINLSTADSSFHRRDTRRAGGSKLGGPKLKPMRPRTLSVPLPAGRFLEAVLEGDPDGTLLVFHHGSPGAAVPFAAFGRAAAKRKIQLVTYSRPGFGDSSRHEGRTIASCADDVEALADHLGADRFITAGWSGGGPHAIACAALLPDRVLAVATVASVAPYDAEGIDWTDGMGEMNQIEYPLAAQDPAALLEWMKPQVNALASIDSTEIVDALRSIISDVDEASMSGELGEVMAASFRRAFPKGRGAGTTMTSPSSRRGDSTSGPLRCPCRCGRAVTT